MDTTIAILRPAGTFPTIAQRTVRAGAGCPDGARLQQSAQGRWHRRRYWPV